MLDPATTGSDRPSVRQIRRHLLPPPSSPPAVVDSPTPAAGRSTAVRPDPGLPLPDPSPAGPGGQFPLFPVPPAARMGHGCCAWLPGAPDSRGSGAGSMTHGVGPSRRVLPSTHHCRQEAAVAMEDPLLRSISALHNSPCSSDGCSGSTNSSTIPPWQPGRRGPSSPRLLGRCSGRSPPSNRHLRIFPTQSSGDGTVARSRWGL
jgi:hypothetical protein